MTGALYAETAAELLEACRGASADVLQRFLTVHQLRGKTGDITEATEIFFEVHHDDPDEAVYTVVLLALQRRWSRGAGDFLRTIETSGVVGDEQLDAVADAFLGESVRLDHPPDWYAGGWTRVELHPDPAAATLAQEEAERDDADAQEEAAIFSVHPVPPEARRWACSRLLVRGKATPAELITVGAEQPATARPAIYRGMLDVYDTIAAPDRGAALSACLSSSAAPVRRRALEQLALEKGPERAAALAATHSDEKVRAWGRRLTEPGGPPDAQAALF